MFPQSNVELVAMLAFYGVAINLVTFLTFAWDKYCARRDYLRVPEARLLLLATLGGTFGAGAAQHYLRHKTRKEPFRTSLRRIAIGQIVVLSALVILLALPAFLG